ncbi:hypothetical protein N8797_01095 [Pontimonas sp.]|nr:hypothetical protein [Pontimonas sp.]
MQNDTKKLGGFMPLFGLSASGHVVHGLKFNSARSAFLEVIRGAEAKEVFLPNFICDSIALNPHLQELQVNFYDLNDDFSLSGNLALGPHSVLLYVNYFGMCDRQAGDVIRGYGKSRVLIDNSQAFFSSPSDSIGSIYSPRKFFGLPDGGLLFSNDNRMLQPDIRDQTSNGRTSHLIQAVEASSSSAYKNFRLAEKEIDTLPVRGMSSLTEDLLSRYDFDFARMKRAENAAFLHSRLSSENKLSLDFSEEPAPLCYPLLPDVSTPTRSELLSKKVFLPSYWPEVLERVQAGSFEWDLASNALFLPCDQRYSVEDMEELLRRLGR